VLLCGRHVLKKIIKRERERGVNSVINDSVFIICRFRAFWFRLFNINYRAYFCARVCVFDSSVV
jgi:hypothetical protein